MWRAVDNNNNMCNICAKELLDSNLNQAVIYKISILTKLPKFHIFKKIVIFKV